GLAARGIVLQLRKNRLEYVLRTQHAAPDLGIDIFGLGEAQLLGDFADGLFGEVLLLVRESLFQNLAAEIHMLIVPRVLEVTADFRARAAGDDELLPQRRRRRAFLADD